MRWPNPVPYVTADGRVIVGGNEGSMGDAKTASAFFKRAFELEPGLRLKAMDDGELNRFWEADDSHPFLAGICEAEGAGTQALR